MDSYSHPNAAKPKKDYDAMLRGMIGHIDRQIENDRRGGARRTRKRR